MVVALLATATPALGATEEGATEEGAVRWSVAPSDADGPDGRVFVEHTIDPGGSVDDHVAVRNVSDHTVTFRLDAADGFYNDAGQFDMLAAGQDSTGAGTWIAMAPTVTVDAGATAVVPFRVTVPADAEPGDHAAGLTASIQSVGDGGLGVDSRVGFRVLTRVSGELRAAVAIAEVRAEYRWSWNPFWLGAAVVSFELANEGNTRIRAAGAVEVGGEGAAFPGATERSSEILPGEARRFEVVVDGVWPLVVVGGQVTATPTAVTFAGDELDVVERRAEFRLLAVPIPQLVSLLGLALVIVALLWNRVTRRRRMAALLAGAREEGRQEAVSGAER